MASTSSSDFWGELRDNLAGVGVDYLRARYVDVERPTDDRNIPDQADLRWWGAGATGDGSGLTAAPGGIPVGGWLVLGGAVILGAWLLRRAL